MICPRCGFAQAPAEECARCGVVVRKVHSAAPPAAPPTRAAAPPAGPGVPPEVPAKPRFPIVSLVLLLAVGLVVQARLRQRDESPKPERAARRGGSPAARVAARVEKNAEKPPAPRFGPPPEEPTAIPARDDSPSSALAAKPDRSQAPVTGWYEGAVGYRTAQEERERWGKPMAVYFHTDWCGWCKKMDSQFLESYETSPYLDTLAKVRINPERGPEEAALARQYGVRGYPSFFIVPASGGGGRRVHPFRREGSMTPAEFVEECRRME